MASVAEIKKAWTAKNAPLIGRKFVAEAWMNGDHSIPLETMANRHEEAGGFSVSREFFKKEIKVQGPHGFTWQEEPFIRVTIEKQQTEMGDLIRGA